MEPQTTSNKAIKILLIEDDRFIEEMYVRSLLKQGYSVDVARTGPEGQQKAATGEFHFVLLDIMLPDKTGAEVLNELRDENGNGLPNTKIIVLTNFDQDDATRAAMESKADGYLIKADITPRHLIEIIQSFN